MKINNISYTPVSNFLIQEKVDELIRYLHLSAEYGWALKEKSYSTNFKHIWMVWQTVIRLSYSIRTTRMNRMTWKRSARSVRQAHAN